MSPPPLHKSGGLTTEVRYYGHGRYRVMVGIGITATVGTANEDIGPGWSAGAGDGRCNNTLQ